MPIISVIVPIYNVEKYLCKCIESIINQTYKNLEIILVDDGSTDNCGKICDDYAKKDERIIVIHKENGGQGSARNKGLDISKGMYIAFVDGDDYIKCDMYEKMYNALVSNKCDMAICGFYNISKIRTTESGISKNPFVMNNDELMETYYTTTLISGSSCNKLYIRDIWNNLRYREDIYREDEYISYDILSKTNRAVHIGTAEYCYVIHENSSERSDFSERNMIGNTSVDRQYELIKENYTWLEPILWDAKCKVRIQQIRDILISKKSKSYMHFVYEMLEFLKKHTANDDDLKKEIRFITKHFNIYAFNVRFRFILRKFLKNILLKIRRN